MNTYSGQSIIGETYQKAELRLCYCEKRLCIRNLHNR